MERYVGISGTAEDCRNCPTVSSCRMEMTCGEEALKSAAKKRFGRTVTMGRAAILTKNHNGRAACHYCGPCEQGCATFSYFNSPSTTIADAQKTGRLTLFTDAVASHVVMKDGKAAGIAYIDRTTREPREVRAKVVVLCASTLESTRLLLNSSICNSSGVLGKYVMDHIYGGGAAGEMPISEAAPWAGPPEAPNGIYVPRFRNVKERSTNGFIRGYGYQGGSSPGFRLRRARALARLTRTPSGKANGISISGCGPSAWRAKKTTSRSTAIAWTPGASPFCSIHAEYGDNEKKLLKDGREQAAEMLEAAGAKNVHLTGRAFRSRVLHP